MRKYIFIATPSMNHFFPLENLVYVRSIPTLTKHEINLAYKESDDHNYILSLTSLQDVMPLIIQGIQDLYTIPEKQVVYFLITDGEFRERSYTH
jgi:hypothetical protein